MIPVFVGEIANPLDHNPERILALRDRKQADTFHFPANDAFADARNLCQQFTQIVSTKHPRGAGKQLADMDLMFKQPSSALVTEKGYE